MTPCAAVDVTPDLDARPLEHASADQTLHTEERLLLEPLDIENKECVRRARGESRREVVESVCAYLGGDLLAQGKGPCPCAERMGRRSMSMSMCARARARVCVCV